jgi:hypothetical protein
MVALYQEQAQAKNLPSTQDDLFHVVLWAHCKSIVWWYNLVASHKCPSSLECGWTIRTTLERKVMVSKQPAPNAVIPLVKCGYIKTKFGTNQCASARRPDFPGQSSAAVCI